MRHCILLATLLVFSTPVFPAEPLGGQLATCWEETSTDVFGNTTQTLNYSLARGSIASGTIRVQFERGLLEPIPKIQSGLLLTIRIGGLLDAADKLLAAAQVTLKDEEARRIERRRSWGLQW